MKISCRLGLLFLLLTIALLPIAPAQARASGEAWLDTVVGGSRAWHGAEGTTPALGSRSPSDAGMVAPYDLDNESSDEFHAARNRLSVRGLTVNRGGRSFNTVAYNSEVGPDGREFGVGMLLVKFKPSAGQTVRSATHRAAGALAVDRIGVSDVERIQVPPGSVPAALAAYQGRADVEYAEPDYFARLTIAPNDPRFGEQYGMTKIGAPQAWDRARSRSDIRVAILDCGIYSRSSQFGSGHPDVRDKVVAEINLTSSPYGADDFCNHGTHVAGIAAAATNNSIGVAGVGFDASIMNVKVLDDSGSSSVSVISQGITWAADNGARVINLSLGSNATCSQTYQLAINYAWSKNVVIVASAGNENLPASGQPANCTNVISVAATDQNDSRASFSNYGTNVDVAAPGVSILSADYVGSYKLISGTSQASPHVAGLAALVWATEYGTSNQAVVSRILSTADPIPGTGSLWTSGRINAAAAVAASGPTPTPTPLPVSCSPRPQVTNSTATGAGRLTVTLTASGANNTIRSVRFGADGRNPVNARVDVPNGPSGMTGAFTHTLTPPSTSFTFQVQRSVAGQATTLPLVVTDGCGTWPTFVGGGTNAGF